MRRTPAAESVSAGHRPDPPLLLKPQCQHDWDVSPGEAVEIQRQLRQRLVLRDDLGEIRRVAGVDCGFEESGTVTRAAVAVLDFPGLDLIEYAVARLPTSFPYVPGLLSF